ncbi:DNA ligase [Rhizobium leguminosarum]|uniref:DNA ligase (ATP) n=1 Tax=Rhizobium leguminosarum TaxID=384 RepID=A0A7K3VMK8_RHILE|nr:DNA ligase [Rhizobium leguminosarum]NEK18074.1 DNA ligase [Rhizobium leguminosarum]
MTKPPRQKSQPLLRETDLPVRSRLLKARDPARPQLPFDPMPDRIEPCLALLKAKPPSGPDWICEADANLYAFDLLYFDGHDLTKMELSGRRHLLEDLIGESEGAIRVSEVLEADGATVLAAACEHGLEGIIVKHRDSAYRWGRLGDWLKIKCIQSDSFVIVGYEPSSAARGGIGSLLLGAYQGNAFVYVGSVGTGFKEKDAMKLRRMLDTLKIKRAPVAVDKKGLVFVQPTLIAEIEYRAWTDDGKLRHSSYKGLREQQDNAAIYKLGE